MNEAIRSFIAVAMPPEVAERLVAAQDRLRPVAGGVKWVDSGSFHVTLKFLGAVEEGRLRETWRSVAEALTGATAFALRLKGVGAFPDARRARVIWAGTKEGREELLGLAERVEQACERHGFARENRPFQGHLTLGRVREPVVNERLVEEIEGLAGEEFGTVRADRVLLMKSELTPKGARYTELEQTLLEQRTT